MGEQYSEIQLVLEQLKRLDKDDFNLKSIEGSTELNECCKLMCNLAVKLDKQKELEKEYEDRFSEIVEVLNSYLLHDYSVKIYVSERGDMLDALALSINLFGEELEESVNIIERQKEQVIASSVSKEVLEKANKQINVLLMEVHHRVKNNLQIICSLIFLQEDKFDGSEVSVELKDLQNRINSMAIVHELLYQSDDISKMDFDRYLIALTSRIADSFHSNRNIISFNIETNGVQLNIDTSVPLGLIINEIISNSFKHAFHGLKEGLVSIKLCEKDDYYILEIQDNGISGTESQFDKNETLGTTLINSLAKQLDGTLTRNLSDGTKYRLKFYEANND